VTPAAFGTAAQTVSVRVAFNGADYTPDDLTTTFEYVPVVTVTAIAPLTGSWRGNTLLTITGTNFKPTGITSCLFDGRIKVPSAYINTTTCICYTPPLLAGAALGSVTVEMSTNDQQFTSNGGMYCRVCTELFHGKMFTHWSFFERCV